MDSSVASTFHSLSIRIELFSGEDSRPVTTFINDLDSYLVSTGKISPAQIKNEKGESVPNPNKDKLEKLVLKASLTGLARQWYDQLDKDLTYEECIASLKKRFSLTDQQVHSKTLKVYRMTQEPGERMIQFIHRVLGASVGLDMDSEQLLQIIVNGAGLHIRPLLMVKFPTSIDDLLDSAIVRDEELIVEKREFVNATTSQEDYTSQDY